MKKPRPHDIDLRTIAWRAMEKYGFVARFPPPVMDEVNGMQERIFAGCPEETCDLRHLLWSSIDNHDSQDLDQLEYCERTPEGAIRVKVAIADVDSYVHQHSPTDEYAAHNGTSVYTGVITFPMLPERLSYGITSLLQDRDRLAVIIEFVVNRDGSFTPKEVYRGLVRNRAKLVYEKVGDWLDGTGPIPPAIKDIPGLEEQVRLQNETAQLLRTFRRAQGALEFDTLEAEVVMENGEVRGLVTRTPDPARALIEEFMVAANGTMVARLGAAGVPMIQRVVKTPRNWAGILLTAAALGETLPDKPDAKALARFLARQKAVDPLHFPDLSLTIIKLLGPGEYTMLEPGETPTGHFALAVVDYTHATAPNRRYVDIINQRQIKAILTKSPGPYSAAELQDKALWLTDREKASKKVKRFMRKSVAAMLLEDSLGKTFEALVTGVADKGTYVRLLTPPAEGRVVKGERNLRVGQKVRVRLLKTDPYNGFIDFECIAREKMD
ncbi:RNB domain-containing ribonuclease [Methanoregula sp.]|uniref:RNB domain-containing ribonuclease n=1 Tax=Methanoregula sp. TaxID=2052170 RepID=UPI002B7253CA|nr:RNB domain-containing ribonuclease [Methanoregula sp.]HVP96344.1 RNB domain-containing ribonuclease [Methanoregula sp.]